MYNITLTLLAAVLLLAGCDADAMRNYYLGHDDTPLDEGATPLDSVDLVEVDDALVQWDVYSEPALRGAVELAVQKLNEAVGLQCFSAIDATWDGPNGEIPPAGAIAARVDECPPKLIGCISWGPNKGAAFNIPAPVVQDKPTEQLAMIAVHEISHKMLNAPDELHADFGPFSNDHVFWVMPPQDAEMIRKACQTGDTNWDRSSELQVASSDSDT